MRDPRSLLSILTLAVIAVTCAPGQFVAPDEATQTVITDETGDLVSPSNFFAENAGHIAPLAPVQSVAGKSGAVALNKVDVGLGNVDNTADLDKPVSTATQSALNSAFADPSEQPGFSMGEWRLDLGLSAADNVQFNTVEAQGLIGTSLIEIGNGVDTTLTRSAPGVLAVDGVDVLTTATGYTRSAADAAFEPLGVAAADITDATATGQAAITAADAADLATAAGLSNVDNTSDADKPVSTAQQTALDTEAATRLAADNRRAFAGGVAFAAAGEMAMTAGANNFGTGDFTISIDRLHLDDYTPGTAGELYATHAAGNNRLQITIQTDGDWRLTFTDDAAATTNYDITPTTALPDYPVSVALTSDRDGNATLYVNRTANGAVDISAASAIDIGSGNTNTNSGQLMGDANLSGIVEGVGPFNRALSSTEAAELSEIGLGAWLAKYPVDKWGSPEFIYDFEDGSSVKSINTPFSIGYYGSTHTSYDGLADNDGIGGAFAGDYCTKIVTNNGYFFILGNLQSSSTYDFSFWFYQPVGNTANVSWNSFADTLTLLSGDISIKGQWEKLSFRVVRTGSSSSPLFRTAPNSSEVIYIDDFQVTELGALAAYPMTEGNGRQLRDLSGRYDALLSETGYEHLIPKSEGYVRVKAADASSAIYMLEASDIIPADSVITDIIAEERKVSVVNTAQDLDDNRIRLNPSGSDLQIQRSDGSTHDTLGTVTAPTSLSDIDAEIHYKQQAR